MKKLVKVKVVKVKVDGIVKMIVHLEKDDIILYKEGRKITYLDCKTKTSYLEIGIEKKSPIQKKGKK